MSRVYCRGTASSRQRRNSKGGFVGLIVPCCQTKDAKENEVQLAEAHLPMRDLQERNQELVGKLQQHEAEAHANTQRLVSELEAAYERSKEGESESYALTIQVETLSNQLKAQSQRVAEAQKERDEVVLQLQQAQERNRSVMQRDGERDRQLDALQILLRETEAQRQRSLTDGIPAHMSRAASMSRACESLPLLTMPA